MGVDESVAYWSRLAAYDLETARALMAAQRHLHVAFFCHQVVEKLLKSRVVAVTGQVPPRTHDLVRLAELAGLELPADRDASLRRLGPLAVLARYPKTDDLENAVDRAIAERLLAETEELERWLRSTRG